MNDRTIRGRATRSQSLRKQAHEARKHAASSAGRGLPSDDIELEAVRLEQEADSLLIAPPVSVSDSGEAILPAGWGQPMVLRNTLLDADATAVEASIQRGDILAGFRLNVVPLALDAAATIGAKDSLEKMLAHQLAVAHVTALSLTAEALNLDARSSTTAGGHFNRETNTERVRLLNAASRFMQTYQEGLATLHKLRAGGTQRVVVQHVHVHQGGQAVVGTVETGRKAGGRAK